MKKLKTQSGITLIALIITIIVMLILVAVTVTVALNGGLFKTAKEATSQTEVEKERELLLEVVMGAMGKNGKVDFEKLETMFEDTGTENGEFFVITESGRKYTITERGSIALQDNAGGGGATTPPEGGEEPEVPGTGETSGAGLYEPDGTFTSWDDLIINGIIGVTDGVLEYFNGYDTNTWAPITGELVISKDVASINMWAFSNCPGLTSINVEESNSDYSSDNGVLYNKDKTILIKCPGGKTGSYTILDSVTSICDEAFSNCYSLTSVTIGSSVTSIGDYAFNWCESLTEVNIPSSVTSIGKSAFGGCSSLTGINVDANNTAYSSDNGVLHNKDKTTLIECPGGKTGSYTILDNVISIENEAFSNCYTLNSLTIGSSVTSIGEWTFSNCTSLTEVNIPSSVTSIGDYAFNCTSLTEVNIPSSVTNIGNNVFYDCIALTGINVDANNPNYSSDNGVLYNEDKTTLIQYPRGKTENSFIIPSSVTSIEGFAFSGCDSLNSVTIGTSVTSIGWNAFSYCSNLTVTLQGSNVEVGNSAFNSVPTVYYAGYVEGTDYSSWGAYQVLPLPSET